MNHFALSALFTSITTFCLAIFVLVQNARSRLYRVFSLYSLSIALWSFFVFLHGFASTKVLSLFAAHTLHIGAIFIPIFFVHFILLFSNDEIRGIRKMFLRLAYLIGFCFLPISFTHLFVKDVVPKYGIKYLMIPGGIPYYFFMSFFGACIIFGLYRLFKEYKNSRGEKRNQMKYLYWSTLFGYMGGIDNFLIVHDINLFPLYPFGTYAVAIYVGITTYAIARYRLLDIRLALTRTAIFAFVYLFVLGIPFWIGYKYHLWQYATVVMAVMATLGPFIFIAITRRAEARILREERRAHELLKQASRGMIHIHSAKELLDITVYTTTKTMKLDNAAVFLINENSGDFKLSAVRFRSKYHYAELIKNDDPLIQKLSTLDEPLVYEEVKLKAQEEKHNLKHPIHEIELQMRKLKAAVIVPAISNKRLIAFLVLGEKLSKRMYSNEDLATLWTLSYQAALAIDNAFLYEKEKIHLAEQSRRQALADMAPGASHQFNNRLATIDATAANLLDLMKNDSDSFSKEELIKMIASDIELIQGEVAKGKQITVAILQKSKVKLEFEKNDIVKVIQNAITLIRLRRTQSSLAGAREPEFAFNYLQGLPQLMLCEGTIQDVFENMFNNSYDAIVIRDKRKIDGPLPYQGKIAINITQNDKSVIITVEDNGIGIEKSNLHKMFTDLFTTKATSEKGVVGGSGLGLNVMRSFVEGHGGTISVESEYAKWTRFTVILPIDFKPPK